MADKKYVTFEKEAFEKMCGLIRESHSVADAIDDANSATNSTYSSYLIEQKLATLSEEDRKYTDEVVGNLSRLVTEVVDTVPTVDTAKTNTLYLYKATDDTGNSYTQYMLINDAIVTLGTTDVNLDNYYNKSDTDDKFATKVDLEGVTNTKGDTLYYDEEKSELQLKSGDNILSSVTIHDGLKIVTWADGTYDEIKAMLSAHYAGLIDISDYWSVGDVRTIPISSISATGVGESQSAQNAEVVIIGFEHDDLVTSVNGNSKSAVSLQLKNSLETVGYMYSAYTGTDYSLWDGLPRRTWCNGVFKNALPTELVSLIKTVTKKTWRYANSGYSGYESYRTQQTTEDDCFLISEFEVFGVQGLSADTYGTVGEDGIQYEYYKTTSNRIKYLGVSGTSANIWWLRSSLVTDSGNSLFRYVGTSGSVSGSFANNTFGVAPGFCI